MKKRLFFSFFIVAFVIVGAFGAIAGLLSYQAFKNQLINDMSHVATLIRIDRLNGVDEQTISYKYGVVGSVSMINEAGELISGFDSSLDKEENVLGREEVREALKNGSEGSSIRYNEKEHAFYINMAYTVLNEILLISVPLVSNYTLAEEFISYAAVVLVISGILASALTYASYRWSLKPVGILVNFIVRTYKHKNVAQVDIQTLPPDLKQIVDIFKEQNRELDTIETKEAEKKLYLLSTINTMENPFIAVDEHSTIKLINKSALNLFKIPSREIAYDNVLKVTQNIDLNMAIMDTRDKLTRQEIVIDEQTFELKVYPLEDRTGKLILLNDITELRKLENMRKEFVSNVSHELKTPLTSIQGFIETLKDGALEDREASKKFLGIIDIESQRLGRLIDDLLSLSDIEGSKVPRNEEQIAVADVAVEICDSLREFADRRQVRLVNEASAPIHYRGNLGLFKAMLFNLASNAIKYNKEGGEVVLHSSLLPGQLVLRVEDTGIGIAKADQERIFERFYKVDKSRSLDPKNTGLGLSIVKHIVELFHGEIQLESELGKGSTFTIRLPLKGE